jgi:murein DD-endopeptidase MepM/ murein hydrolase activator NlpD
VRSLVLVALTWQLAAAPAAPLAVTARARALRPGELVVLTIRTRTPVEAVRVEAFGRDLLPYAVDATTWRTLVGIDLSTTPGTYKIRVASDAPAAEVTYPLTVMRKRFPTRTLSVDPAFVTPPADAAERIARESKRLGDIWTRTTSERLWSGTFVRPVPQPANSAFGTHSVFNGEPRSQHGGADFRSPDGTPIKAPNAGRVVLAEDLYFSGGTVVLDHGRGLFSLFAHLSAVDVAAGDLVERGQAIGLVGATGRVTGPHLHWALRVNGARVDPLSLLALLGAR